jgi:hypothetical protein
MNFLQKYRFILLTAAVLAASGFPVFAGTVSASCNWADTDNDGFVGASDYLTLKGYFGQSCVPDSSFCYCHGADINKDGKVDRDDLSILENVFGPVPATSVAITGANSATSVLNGNALQMSAVVSPTNTTVTWLVAPGTGTATIDSASGLLTATGAGTVTVTAIATSGFAATGTEIITVNPVPGQSAVNLGTAGNFAILAKTAVTTTGITSITGNIGISPAAASDTTGFGLVLDSTGCFSVADPLSLVIGKIYAADYSTHGCTTPAVLTTAVSDMQTAYTDAAGRPHGFGPNLNLGGGTVATQTLAPGVYTWGSDVTITGDITLTGTATDVWIFQISGTLNLADGVKINLSGGALPQNIFWQVADVVTLKPGSHFEGNILAQTNIAMQTGATLNGRALAQTAVTLDANTLLASTGDIIIPVVPVTPATPAVTNDDTANTVAGMAAGMEYKLDSATDYVAYNAETFATLDFSGGHTLLVRVAAVGINPVSADTTLTFTVNPVVLAPTPTPTPAPTAVPAATTPAPARGGGGGLLLAIPSVKTLKVGDANADNNVDELDLGVLMAQWGQAGTGFSGDFNKDGVVDELDFALLMANWGL